MRTPLPAGKLPPELLRELLPSSAGLPPEVRLGPAIGEDACAIDLPAGTLVAATDPITLTSSDVGAHAVTINANDVAVMGVRPRWFLAVVLLPCSTAESDVRALFASMHSALDALGAVLVGGHTEVTSAVNQPIVVGQMLGQCGERAFIPTGGVLPGDAILQVGPAPVEAAAVLADAAGSSAAQISAETLGDARNAVSEPGISVVEAALLCAEAGATALHDPTEGGLSAGLYELAEASGVCLQLDEQSVLWFEPGRSLCRHFGADPWGALASGALLASFPAARAVEACEQLAALGIPARQIAAALPGSGVLLSDGSALARFAVDELARVLGDSPTR